MSTEIVMLVGSPASGKGRTANRFIDQGYFHLNRDTVGGKVIDLLPMMDNAIKAKKNIILDNTFPTAVSRKPFVELAKRNKVSVRCLVIGTTMEDCSINALMRMWDRYGKLFMTPEDLKEVKGDPNMFPIAALFAYKKEFQEPKSSEGFASVEQVPFKRFWTGNLANKAVMVDFDDTLRTVKAGAKYKFPTKTSEIEILPRRKEILASWAKRGYGIIGASNQSGIARGQVSKEQAEECFKHTCDAVFPANSTVRVMYCPHNVPPTCYCRKPQSGMGVHYIRELSLNPSEVIYVGDQTTDKTFAKRLGFQYADQADFFK